MCVSQIGRARWHRAAGLRGQSTRRRTGSHAPAGVTHKPVRLLAAWGRSGFRGATTTPDTSGPAEREGNARHAPGTRAARTVRLAAGRTRGRASRRPEPPKGPRIGNPGMLCWRGLDNLEAHRDAPGLRGELVARPAGWRAARRPLAGPESYWTEPRRTVRTFAGSWPYYRGPSGIARWADRVWRNPIPDASAAFTVRQP